MPVQLTEKAPYANGREKDVEREVSEDEFIPPKGRYVEDHARVKKILRKADMRILPVMSILYLLSFLDRTAIGNARIAGLARDLNMTDQEYNITVTVFFVLYGLLEVPSNLCLKKFGTRQWISFIMTIWGIIMALTCVVKNFTGLLVARLFLGAAEAGLFPGVTYYLTTWYTRKESQYRVGVFFSAATIAGAFGGLLAYGLTRIEGTALRPWAYIFLVEGLLTIVVAVVAYFAITNSPSSAKWLTPEEKHILQERLKFDGVEVPMNNEFKWAFVRAGFLDLKVWLAFIIYACILCPLYSIALNLPAITVGLGYTGPEAQLITVPVYITAAIFCLVLAIIADKYHLRSPILLFGFTFALIGNIMMYVTTIPGVRYAGTFLAASGSYGAFPAIVCALSNNIGGQTKRSVGLALLIGIGGMAGMISSNIFPSAEGPRFLPGIRINIALCSVGLVFTLVNVAYLIFANRRKQKLIDSGEAATYSHEQLADMGDESPYFKYTL